MTVLPAHASCLIDLLLPELLLLLLWLAWLLLLLPHAVVLMGMLQYYACPSGMVALLCWLTNCCFQHFFVGGRTRGRGGQTSLILPPGFFLCSVASFQNAQGKSTKQAQNPQA